jgi:spermidine synthase
VPDQREPIDQRQPSEALRTLATTVDDGVDLVLRQRTPVGGPAVLELIVDGVFAMDSLDASTEVALAEQALDRLSADPPWTVVVGGLGLGFTAAAVLADPRVARVVVVELHAAVAAWARETLLPVAAGALADPRTELVVGDVLTVVPALAPDVDAVLLDVDNGPDFLVHPGNAAVYADPFLLGAAAVLRPGGVLAIWSADRAPELQQRLARHLGSCQEVRLDVERAGRVFSYSLLVAARG